MAVYTLTPSQLRGAGIYNSFEIPAGGGFINTYSVAFDGTDDYVGCGNDSSLQPTDEFSISSWFKTVEGDTGRNQIWSKVYFRLAVEPTSGRLNLVVFRSNTQATFVYTPAGTSYADAEWHHVVATFKKSDTKRYKIYVDGELKIEVAGYDSNVNASSHSFNIGTNNLVGSNDMNGNIDEAAFWKTKLTLTDVQNIYNDGVANDISSYNPISWWRMGDDDGGTGTTVTDQGSGGNDGTLVNNATFETDVPS